MSGPAPD